MLTPEAVNQLLAPFPFGAHEWLKGFVYVTEYDITRRLFDVDPNWCWELRELRETVIATQTMYIAHGRLTICGVSRDGIGQAVQEFTKDGARPMGEAGKSATTDAFKRAARMFGVGNYLLNNPPACSASPTPPERKAFEAWLEKQGGVTITNSAQGVEPTEQTNRVVTVTGVMRNTASNGDVYYTFETPALKQDVVFAWDLKAFVLAGYNVDAWVDLAVGSSLALSKVLDGSDRIDGVTVAQTKKAGTWRVTHVTDNPNAELDDGVFAS